MNIGVRRIRMAIYFEWIEVFMEEWIEWLGPKDPTIQSIIT
jgi:hypothetical protein